ncbi:MAG TPA: amino acid ABC transporter permease, partial [Desulfobacterales bacterium]|nr:amino acid ABC transporter permease [Desulfobacterales bacterium]
MSKLIYNPKFRAWFIQGCVLVILLTLLGTGVYNTVQNLGKAGITTGFGFLNETAGFDISLKLIPYSRASTYGRAFMVGLLNTLLVSGIGILVATILGFLIGVARLSSNWLISLIAAVYIEIIRNIPLLLQILFWYIAILNPLPRPRHAMNLMDTFFLCNRGLIVPSPIYESGIIATLIALGTAIVASIFLVRWAGKHQNKTGKQFPAYWTSLGLLIGLPLMVLALTGFPISWEIPVFKGFNFRGGLTMLPEFIALCLA